MPITPEQQAELAATAGETRSKGPRMELKTLRFDGKSGELRLIELNGEQVPVTIPAELVILKKRNVLKAFTDQSYFTTEYDFTSSIISLFTMENSKVKHLASATPPQLRAQYPFLKSQQVGYALFNHEVVKFEIKGASFSSFIDYTKTLQDQKLHSYQVVTQISGVGSGKKGTVNYRFMEFTYRDLESDEFNEVKGALDDTTKQLYAIDKYYAEKKAAAAPDAHDTPDADADPLAAEFDSPAADAINPEDIPF